MSISVSPAILLIILLHLTRVVLPFVKATVKVNHNSNSIPSANGLDLGIGESADNNLISETSFLLLEISNAAALHHKFDIVLVTDFETKVETWQLGGFSMIHYNNCGEDGGTKFPLGRSRKFCTNTASLLALANRSNSNVLFVLSLRNLTSSLTLAQKMSNSAKHLANFLIISPRSPEKGSMKEDESASLGLSLKYLTLASTIFILRRPRGKDDCGVDLEEFYNIQGHFITRRIPRVPVAKMLDVMLYRTERRSNFQNSNITAIIGKSRLYNSTLGAFDRNQVNDIYTDLFLYLRDALNFEVLTVVTNGAPNAWPNGTLKGSAVQLSRGAGQIDIAGTEMIDYRVNGSDGISYLMAVYANGFYAYFKQLPRSSTSNTFVRPFSKGLWVSYFCCWAVILISSVAGGIVTRQLVLHTVGLRGLRTKTPKSTPFSHIELIMLWCVSSITRQGWYKCPRSFHTRTIFLVGSSLVMLMFVAYSAVLTSFLSLDTRPIQDYSDLLKYNYRVMGDSRNPTSTLLSNGSVINPKYEYLPEGFLNSEVTIISTMQFSQHLTSMNYSIPDICRTISIVPVHAVLPRKAGFIVKKGSAYREFFNYKLSVAQERGILNRLTRHRHELNVQCDLAQPRSKLKFNELTLDDLATPFTILVLVGFLFSFFIFYLEFCCMRSSSNGIEYCP